MERVDILPRTETMGISVDIDLVLADQKEQQSSGPSKLELIAIFVVGNHAGAMVGSAPRVATKNFYGRRRSDATLKSVRVVRPGQIVRRGGGRETEGARKGAGAKSGWAARKRPGPVRFRGGRASNVA